MYRSGDPTISPRGSSSREGRQPKSRLGKSGIDQVDQVTGVGDFQSLSWIGQAAFACKASRTASGFESATCNNAIAAPSG